MHEVSLELFRAIATDPVIALKEIADVPTDSIGFLKMMAEQSVKSYEANETSTPWLGDVATGNGTNELVGSSGFKGPPNDKGEIEIA